MIEEDKILEDQDMLDGIENYKPEKLSVLQRIKKMEKVGEVRGFKVYVFSMEQGRYVEIFEQPFKGFMESEGEEREKEIQEYIETIDKIFYDGDGDELAKIRLKNGLDHVYIREPRKYIFKFELY